jgi:hypothetical protein
MLVVEVQLGQEPYQVEVLDLQEALGLFAFDLVEDLDSFLD